MSAPTPVPAGARSGARRHRARVLAAARAEFAEHGTALTVQQVARRAGVAVHTVHTNYPGKDTLVEAVLVAHTDELVSLVRRRFDDPDPGPAFFAVLGEAVDRVARYRHLCGAFVADRSWPRAGIAAAAHRFDTALDRLLQAARAGEPCGRTWRSPTCTRSSWGRVRCARRDRGPGRWSSAFSGRSPRTQAPSRNPRRSVTTGRRCHAAPSAARRCNGPPSAVRRATAARAAVSGPGAGVRPPRTPEHGGRFTASSSPPDSCADGRRRTLVP